ncbi:hypothetical protein CRM22_007704 [Opisthorchis felineus]|uniref:Uncharacterized protein n=1 Tax=Opisthorchis felineus TaxID=147828 RepID=A0A4S2LME9_OPIFE|nr:hypothetical protein CRM22_007704 [Opisthorchis felineus]
MKLTTSERINITRDFTRIGSPSPTNSYDQGVSCDILHLLRLPGHVRPKCTDRHYILSLDQLVLYPEKAFYFTVTDVFPVLGFCRLCFIVFFSFSSIFSVRS